MSISIGTPVVETGASGQQGVQGIKGAPTPLPTPLPGTVSGRLGGVGYVPSLYLGGSGAGYQLSGGINFPISQLGTPPTSVAHHIILWAPNDYGLNFDDSTATSNIVTQSGSYFDFYSGGSWALRFQANQLCWSTDSWRFDWNPGNGDFLYYTYNNNPYFGCSVGMNNFVVWGNFEALGTCWLFDSSYPGVQYYNIVGNWFRFYWASQYSMVYNYVDSTFTIYLANACDERLKQDVSPSSFDCLATIRKIRLYEYRWKDWTDPNKLKLVSSDKPIVPIGFVAQRLCEDFPEAVPTAADNWIKGNDYAGPLWNADTNTMLATLVGACKQLDAEITALEAKRVKS